MGSGKSKQKKEAEAPEPPTPPPPPPPPPPPVIAPPPEHVDPSTHKGEAGAPSGQHNNDVPPAPTQPGDAQAAMPLTAAPPADSFDPAFGDHDARNSRSTGEDSAEQSGASWKTQVGAAASGPPPNAPEIVPHVDHGQGQGFSHTIASASAQPPPPIHTGKTGGKGPFADTDSGYAGYGEPLGSPRPPGPAAVQAPYSQPGIAGVPTPVAASPPAGPHPVTPEAYVPSPPKAAPRPPPDRGSLPDAGSAWDMGGIEAAPHASVLEPHGGTPLQTLEGRASTYGEADDDDEVEDGPPNEVGGAMLQPPMHPMSPAIHSPRSPSPEPGSPGVVAAVLGGSMRGQRAKLNNAREEIIEVGIEEAPTSVELLGGPEETSVELPPGQDWSAEGEGEGENEPTPITKMAMEVGLMGSGDGGGWDDVDGGEGYAGRVYGDDMSPMSKMLAERLGSPPPAIGLDEGTYNGTFDDVRSPFPPSGGNPSIDQSSIQALQMELDDLAGGGGPPGGIQPPGGGGGGGGVGGVGGVNKQDNGRGPPGRPPPPEDVPKEEVDVLEELSRMRIGEWNDLPEIKPPAPSAPSKYMGSVSEEWVPKPGGRPSQAGGEWKPLPALATSASPLVTLIDDDEEALMDAIVGG